MRCVAGDCVDDYAFELGGELLEETNGEIVGVWALDDVPFEGNLYCEPFAGVDRNAELAGVGASQDEYRYPVFLTADSDLLLEDTDDFDSDLTRSGGHGFVLPRARLGSLGFLAELALDPLEEFGVG